MDDHLDDDPRMVAATNAELGAFHRVLPRCLRSDSPTIPALIADTFAERDRLVVLGLWVLADSEYAVAPDLWVKIAIPTELREKRRRAALARWAPSKSSANGEHMQSEGYAESVPVTRTPSPVAHTPSARAREDGPAPLDAFVDDPLVQQWIETARAAGYNDFALAPQLGDLGASVREARASSVPEDVLRAAVVTNAAKCGPTKRLDIDVARAQRGPASNGERFVSTAEKLGLTREMHWTGDET
jgi:hypothetical protein